MIGIVITAHDQLAEALVQTAKSVFPEGGDVQTVSITSIDSATSYSERLREAVAKVDRGEGVLVLTDMFGGTPSNVGLTLHQPGHIEVMTGANLPMLIKALQLGTKGEKLEAIARQVKEHGQRSISIASEVLGFAPLEKKVEVKS